MTNINNPLAAVTFSQKIARSELLPDLSGDFTYRTAETARAAFIKTVQDALDLDGTGDIKAQLDARSKAEKYLYISLKNEIERAFGIGKDEPTNSRMLEKLQARITEVNFISSDEFEAIRNNAYAAALKIVEDTVSENRTALRSTKKSETEMGDLTYRTIGKLKYRFNEAISRKLQQISSGADEAKCIEIDMLRDLSTNYPQPLSGDTNFTNSDLDKILAEKLATAIAKGDAGGLAKYDGDRNEVTIAAYQAAIEAFKEATTVKCSTVPLP